MNFLLADMQTIKEEVIWLNEFETLAEAKEKIGKWIEIDYNKLYGHSELVYFSPLEFEALCNQEKSRQVV